MRHLALTRSTSTLITSGVALTLFFSSDLHSQSYKNLTPSERTLTAKAAHQRERGAKLHAALCTSCHDGKQTRDLLQPDPTWNPGPLTLLSALQDKTPNPTNGHNFRYLAEEDLMGMVQHIRQQAKLTQQFDEAHVPQHVEQTIYPTDPQTGDPLAPCYEPIKQAIELELQDNSRDTLERGESLWSTRCASCHDASSDSKAPALTKLDTIWRRRVSRHSIYLTLTNEELIAAHKDLKRPEESSQWWPLLTWMKESGHVPAQKWSEEPEIPWRGEVVKLCRERSAVVKREPVPDALLDDPAAYWSTLEEDTLLKDTNAQSATELDATKLLLEQPCLGCHTDPINASTKTLIDALSAKSPQKHPDYSKTYTATQWHAITHDLTKNTELLTLLKGTPTPAEPTTSSP